MGMQETVKEMQERTGTVLANKPIWVFWLVYAGISGVLFGVFYAVTSLLVIRWWVLILVILLIGIVWGSFAFTRSSRAVPREKTEGE